MMHTSQQIDGNLLGPHMLLVLLARARAGAPAAAAQRALAAAVPGTLERLLKVHDGVPERLVEYFQRVEYVWRPAAVPLSRRQLIPFRYLQLIISDPFNWWWRHASETQTIELTRSGHRLPQTTDVKTEKKTVGQQ
jgi:hypothetical protein